MMNPNNAASEIEKEQVISCPCFSKKMHLLGSEVTRFSSLQIIGMMEKEMEYRVDMFNK